MTSHAIKLTGKFELAAPLEIDTTYTMALEADITSIAKQSQDDGSYEFTYTAKPIRGEILDHGKPIRIEKKSSQSAKLNAQIRMIAKEQGLDEDIEYEKYMVLLRHFWPMVQPYLDQLNKNENGI